MNTPICDFVDRYAASAPVRLHMPGHKGTGPLGCESRDLTELDGADDLYHPSGVIRESERNAASLFGTGETLYSTEGSSQCIRAMLYLAVLAFQEKHPGERPAVLAGRNAHKAFLTAAALLDFDIVWLCPENREYSLCRCAFGREQLGTLLRQTPHAAAVYLTSPDYLGHTAAVAPLAAVARQWGVPLLVDNAHGAYLGFLSPSRHPIAQGADLCCDSAHKTLPVLTGGAYLHLAAEAPAGFFSHAREAMALFGSTSPSYLILQSLDQANRALAGDYPQRLAEAVCQLDGLKRRLGRQGWGFTGDEPLKLTLDTRSFGYTGGELAALLKKRRVYCEYADPDYLVLMPGPGNLPALDALEKALAGIEERPALPPPELPPFRRPERRMSLRQALFLPSQPVPVQEAVGRTAASLAVSCPPAVCPVAPGEVVSEEAVQVCQYYGIEKLSVLKAF